MTHIVIRIADDGDFTTVGPFGTWGSAMEFAMKMVEMGRPQGTFYVIDVWALDYSPEQYLAHMTSESN